MKYGRDSGKYGVVGLWEEGVYMRMWEVKGDECAALPSVTSSVTSLSDTVLYSEPYHFVHAATDYGLL